MLVLELGIVGCSFYTRRITLEDDYVKKKGHSCIRSCRVQLFEDTSKNIHNPSATKSIHSIR